MESQPQLMTFPCEYLLKVMGENNHDFDLLVVEIVRKHCPQLGEAAVSVRESKGGKYLAVSVKFIADNKAQLDNLYLELSQHKRVIMVL